MISVEFVDDGISKTIKHLRSDFDDMQYEVWYCTCISFYCHKFHPQNTGGCTCIWNKGLPTMYVVVCKVVHVPACPRLMDFM